MTRGGNTGMFYQNKAKYDDAVNALRIRDNELRTMYRGAAKPTGYYNDPLARSMGEAKEVLNDVHSAAFNNYKRLGGEAEARAVEKQLETGDYKTLPLSLLNDFTGPRISGPDAVPAVDSTPGVQAVIDWILKAPK